MSKPVAKSLTVERREPNRCLVCKSAEVSICISYRDRDNPLSPRLEYSPHKFFVGPLQSGYACDRHVHEVTAIILKKAGIEEPNENNQGAVESSD